MARVRSEADPYPGNIAAPNNTNHYTFAGEDPINNTDVSGADWFNVFAGALGAISGYGLGFSIAEIPAIAAVLVVVPELMPAVLIGAAVIGGISAFVGSEFVSEGVEPAVG